MKDLFGSVIPDTRLLFYQVFFPSGYETLLLGVIVMGLSFGVFLFSHLIEKNTSKTMHYTVNDIAKIFLLVFTIGILIPLIGGIFVEFLIWRSLISIKNTKSFFKKKSSTLIKILRVLFILLEFILYIFMFLLLPAGGYIVYYYFGNIFWLLIAIGIDIGLVIIFVKGKSPSKKEETLRSFLIPETRAVKGAIVILPLVFTSVFLSCWVFVPHNKSPSNQTGTIGTNTLTIVTYNVRNGRALDGEDSWSERKEYFNDQVSEFDADIIGLQEAYLFQINDIVKGLRQRNPEREYQWTGLGRDDGVHSGEHCPILFDASQYEYEDGDTFWLGDNYKYPVYGYAEGQCCKRVVTWARFRSIEKNSEFLVFCTHYGFGEGFSNPASELIVSRVEDLSGELPAFVMGDFNFNEGSTSFPIMKSSEKKTLRDAYSDIHGPAPHNISTTNSFNADFTNRPHKIDYIFVSEEVTVQECEVNQDTYNKDGIERCYSDHFPVIAECTF